MRLDMPNLAILDIETQDAIQGSLEGLRVSVVCVYYSGDDSWESYTEDRLPELFSKLEGVDGIVGYNTIGFDIPVLNAYYAGDLLKIPQIDMLDRIRQSLGFRLKLDTVAAATVGAKKSAHGLQAVQWWKEGRVQDVIDYCMQDVKVTKEVFDFGSEKGFVLFDDRMGERQQVNVDFSLPQKESAINLTMGF